ncbi:MAG: hypothetical protein R2793_08295 [Flavobacteriaceae bacterium]
MKKLLLFAACAVFGMTASFAQDGDGGGATDEGSIMININTGFGEVGGTGFYLTSRDGNTAWNVGADVGYFIIDDLAIRAGLGYGDSGGDGPGSSSFSYKIGAKYYVISTIPVGVDYSGTSFNDVDENPSFLGLQAAYAWFIADNVSIEPGLRYNLSLNDEFYDSTFNFNIGFALFLD